MRIDAYNQIATLYKTTKPSKAKSTVAAASDIREDRVAELKSSIKSGNYDVDTGDFASHLLASYYAAN